ncbi:histidine kinase dimerization/phospho-acceptor domain-containing protein [Bradyrhizobium sp. TM239]
MGVLGHDLRNPLAAISAGARILQRSGAPQEQYAFST